MTRTDPRRLELDAMHADVCKNAADLTPSERVFLLVVGGLLACGCEVSASDEERLREIAAKRA